MARRFVVNDHLRNCTVWDTKREVTVASGMTRALARKVARMLNAEASHNGRSTEP